MLNSSISSVRGDRLTVSEPGNRRREAAPMTASRQAMSSSAVRPVASAAANIVPGSLKPLLGSGRTRPFEAARGTADQVVDRLEDRTDGAARGDPGDQRRQLGRLVLGRGALVPLAVVDA